MSSLRAKCPDCKGYTAVALGPEYQCHACGREFAAGLVRVPRAWGKGGERMAQAARLPLPYPEAAVVAEDSPVAQAVGVALDLPERPVVLGGCCAAHVGAIEALGARHERIALVWLDAHGDLNTPESSPSGNEWGMALRTVLDSGAAQVGDVVLLGARALDPPEREYIARSGLRTRPEQLAGALAGASGAYVAIDFDVLDADQGDPFMPEPGGMSLDEAEELLGRVAASTTVLGAGLSGLTADARNIEPSRRLLRALGL